MSLFDKLKPKTKKPGIGKTVECKRCGGMNAEHYSANYIHCPRCDKPADKATKAATATASTTGDFVDFELTFDDEDTNPGGWTQLNLPLPPPPKANPSRLYICASCRQVKSYRLGSVAAGQLCDEPDVKQFGGVCGGYLRAYP